MNSRATHSETDKTYYEGDTIAVSFFFMFIQGVIGSSLLIRMTLRKKEQE
jgi:hypothetical protein